MLSLFTCRRRQQEVHRLLARLVNEWVAQRDRGHSGRLTTRTDVRLPAMLVPLCDAALLLDCAAPALVVDISCEGMGLVLCGPFPHRELVVALPGHDGFCYLQAVVRGSKSLPFGFRELGVEVTELVNRATYPELDSFPNTPSGTLPVATA